MIGTLLLLYGLPKAGVASGTNVIASMVVRTRQGLAAHGTVGYVVVKNSLVMSVYETLLAHYGELGWWPARTPYEMMVGAVNDGKVEFRKKANGRSYVSVVPAEA